MKRIFSILCIISLLAVLTACGGPAAEAPAPTEAPAAVSEPKNETPAEAAPAEAEPATEAAEVPVEEPGIVFTPHVDRIQANACYSYGLTSEGTLIASAAPNIQGDNVVKTLPEYQSWTGIRNFSSSSEAVAAVLEDGTVVMCGGLVDEMSYCDFSAVSQWRDAVQVAMGKHCIVALMADGSVEIAGELLTEDLPEHTGFVQVEAGCEAMGLKADGTAVVWSWYWDDPIDAVDSWTDLTYISSTWNHIVALKADGTVFACGNNDYGQCEVGDWADIVAVSAGVEFTLGLKSDGTVVFCGSDSDGSFDFSGWTDIVAIDAGFYHCVGLRSDGSVVSTGANWNGQCSTDGWNLK